MKVKHAFFVFHLLLFVVSSLLFACEKDDNPTASSECGSGRVFWDDKTGCRDAVTNAKLPDHCCGR